MPELLPVIFHTPSNQRTEYGAQKWGIRFTPTSLQSPAYLGTCINLLFTHIAPAIQRSENVIYYLASLVSTEHFYVVHGTERFCWMNGGRNMVVVECQALFWAPGQHHQNNKD